MQVAYFSTSNIYKVHCPSSHFMLGDTFTIRDFSDYKSNGKFVFFIFYSTKCCLIFVNVTCMNLAIQ